MTSQVPHQPLRSNAEIEHAVAERLALVMQRGLGSDSNATEALTLRWVLGVIRNA